MGPEIKEYLYKERAFRKSRVKDVVVILLAAIIILFLIRFSLGKLEFRNPFGFVENETRAYKLTINDYLLSSVANKKKSFPIIPFVVDFVTTGEDTSYYTDEERSVSTIPTAPKYELDAASFSCYSKKYDGYQESCKQDKMFIDLTLNDDTEYYDLIIYKEDEIVYEGKFIKDITPYIESGYKYKLKILAKHSSIKTIIRTSFTVQ